MMSPQVGTQTNKKKYRCQTFFFPLRPIQVQEILPVRSRLSKNEVEYRRKVLELWVLQVQLGISALMVIASKLNTLLLFFYYCLIKSSMICIHSFNLLLALTINSSSNIKYFVFWLTCMFVFYACSTILLNKLSYIFWDIGREWGSFDRCSVLFLWQPLVWETFILKSFTKRLVISVDQVKFGA